MRAVRTLYLMLVAVVAAGVARAQVAPPAAEPGSVPEAQPAPPAPGQQPAADRPVRIAGGVIAGQKISGTPPVYPADAKAQGVGGAVVMHAIIGRDGRIAKLTVVSGDPLLAGAATDAVQTWVYKPFLLNGEPTEVDTTITVNFNLGGGAAVLGGLPEVPGLKTDLR